MTNLTISLGASDDRQSVAGYDNYEGPVPVVGDIVSFFEWPSRLKDPDCDIPEGEQRELYAAKVVQRIVSWGTRPPVVTTFVEICCELYESKG